MSEHYGIYGSSLSLLPAYVLTALRDFCARRSIDPFAIGQVMRNVQGWTVAYGDGGEFLRHERFIAAEDAERYGR